MKDRLQNYIQDPHALDLLDRLLTLDPSRRIDTESALDHDFFFSDPLPADCAGVLRQCDRHMFEFLTKNNNGHHHHHQQNQAAIQAHSAAQKNAALKSAAAANNSAGGNMPGVTSSATGSNQRGGYHRNNNNAANGNGNNSMIHSQQGRRTAHQAGMSNSGHPPQRKPHRNPDQHYEQIF